MPKLLHERLRGLLPESVRSRIPEKYQPPAWRTPVNPVPAAAKDETGAVAWALGDAAELNTDFTATLDAKEKTLHPPVLLPQGTVGRVVALGPDFVVLSVDSAPGVRVSKAVVVNLDDPSAARWARVAAPEEWQLSPEGEPYPNEQQVLVEPKRTPKPLEVAPDAGLENILRVYREATPDEAAYWGKWYHNARTDVEALAAHYGLPFEQVAAVVAALSPGNKWASNLRAADDVLSGNFRTNAYPNALVKARHILETGDISGIQTPKVWIFYQSLLDPDAVSSQMVLDGHAINIWRGDRVPLKGLKAPTAAERAQMLADYQRAAETLGVPVQAVQAVTWYIWKYTTGGRTARIAFPAKEQAWQTLLEESGISYPPDFTAADVAYKKWKRQYAKYRHSPRPVYEGGELDAVNQALSLTGDARVSGLFEGFERLTRNVRDWQDPALERAIEVLRDVPGLETLRLPEFVMERDLEEAEAEHWRRLEEEQEYTAALRVTAADGEREALRALYTALYNRALAAGAISHNGTLAVGSGRLRPPAYAIEKFLEHGPKLGLSDAEAIADLRDYLTVELTQEIEAFEAGAAERKLQRQQEQEEARLEALGQDASDWNTQRGVPRKLRGKRVWMYHATSSALLPEILKHGLLAEPPGRTNVGTGASQQAGVYLHTSGVGPEVDHYLRQAVYMHGGDPVLLRVLVDADRLEADPDDADLTSGARQALYRDDIPPSDIYQVGSAWTDAARTQVSKKQRIGMSDVIPLVRVGGLWRVRGLATARDPWASWTTRGDGREVADEIAVAVAGDGLGRWWAARKKGMDAIWREEGQAATVEDAQAAALAALNTQRAAEGLRAVPAPPAAVSTTPDALKQREREETTQRRQQQERERVQLPSSGWYPDLFLGPGEARGSGGEENVLSDDGTIVHYASPDLSWHRFVYNADGEAVSGLSLRATRPRGGVQTATIDRVCTKPEHQRQGYAAALMSAAREYFRKVLHSKDLTNDGRAWKRRVGAGSVGTRIETREGVFVVDAEREGEVHLVQEGGGYGQWIPAVSLPQVVSDLRGEPPEALRGMASGNTAVDAVLRGEGEFLGRGNDGVVWRVGDTVVKASTVVPYQPMNPGYRTPEQAVARMEAAVERQNELADAGVVGVPRSELVVVGDKAFQVKPYLTKTDRLELSHLDDIARTTYGLHSRGLTFAESDPWQVGLDAAGRVQFFDLGAVEPAKPSKDKFWDPYTRERESLADLYKAHGQPFLPPADAGLLEAWNDLTSKAASMWFLDEEDSVEWAARVRQLGAAAVAAGLIDADTVEAAIATQADARARAEARRAKASLIRVCQAAVVAAGLTEVSREDVLAAQRRADAEGKHQRADVHDWESRLPPGPYVLVDLPLADLNAAGVNDERVREYAARGGPFPPVLGFYNERSGRVGSTQVYIANGNHRVEAARLTGASTIGVYMPKDHYDRWVSRGVEKTAADGIPAGHAVWRDMPIAIEVPGGGVRFPGGAYETYVPADWKGYGYFEGLPAEDGDSLDVVMGPAFSDACEPVYLATQCDAESGEFTQFKVMIGFESLLAAEAAFKMLWPTSMFGGITEVPAVPFERAVLPKIVVDAQARMTIGRARSLRVGAFEEDYKKSGALVKKRPRIEYDVICPHCDEIVREKSVSFMPPDFESMKHSCGGLIEMKTPEERTEARAALEALYPSLRTAAAWDIRALGNGTYTVQVDGREVARANVVDDGRGDYLTSVHVENDYKRQGIATALYDFIEADLGRALRPSPTYQSPDAEAFWRSRVAATGDVVVTLPKAFGLEAWMAEGDAPGTPATGQEYAFHCGGRPPRRTKPGDRVYVVHDGRLIGYAPLIRIDVDPDNRGFSFIRSGGAVACTVDMELPGFRGYRYRMWDRSEERALHSAMVVTAGVTLTRTGYQRYSGALPDGRRVWVGCESRVSHGTYPAGRRQKRDNVWIVRIDGADLGESRTFAEARALLERAAAEVRVAHEVDPVTVTARMREKDTPGSSACIVIPVPESLAKMWPDARGEHDASPPHITVLYLGDATDRLDEARDLLTTVASEFKPIPVEFAKGTSWFTNDEGLQIAHKAMHPKTEERLQALHAALREAFTAAGFAIQHREGFTGHATLGYFETQEAVRGPEGGFSARTLELWGWPEDVVATLGARTARRRRKNKRRRYIAEIYYRRPGEDVAYTTRAVAGASAVEVRLRPGARVMRGESLALIERARLFGYDAVRRADQLVILNEEVLCAS